MELLDIFRKTGSDWSLGSMKEWKAKSNALRVGKCFRIKCRRASPYWHAARRQAMLWLAGGGDTLTQATINAT